MGFGFWALATCVRVCVCLTICGAIAIFTLFIYIALFFKELMELVLLNAEGCISWIARLDNPGLCGIFHSSCGRVHGSL